MSKKKTKVVVEVYEYGSVNNYETFTGRLLGYITEADFSKLLSNNEMRLATFTGKTTKLRELHQAGAAILDQRVVFVITNTEDEVLTDKYLFVTAPIAEELTYTEKERASIEFMGLETTNGDWISIVEEEN